MRLGSRSFIRCAVCFALALCAGGARAQETRAVSGMLAPTSTRTATDPELERLARELEGLARDGKSEDPAFGDAIRQGRAAVLAARTAVIEQRGDELAIKRRIVRAALELAARCVARSEELRAQAAAQQRAAAAEQAKQLATRALAEAEARRTAQAEAK